MMRIILPVLAIALVVTLGIYIDAQSGTMARHPEEVPAPASIFAPGRVEGATREVQLRPQVRGRIIQLLVEEGQIADAGQPLLRLDDKEHQHQVALAESQIRLAENERDRLRNGARKEERQEAASLHRAKLAELEQARLTWERVEKLGNAVTQQEVDDKRSRVKALTAEVWAAKARVDLLNAPARPDELGIAEAEISAAKARLQLAKVQLERTELAAPFDGQILKIFAELGELAGPDSPEPAIIVSDTSEFRVRAFVEELDAPRVKLGVTAKILADGLPGRTYTGRVVQLSPRMSDKLLWSDDPEERYDTKTRELVIELEDDDAGLVVGLRVDVIIDAEPAAPPQEIEEAVGDSA
jgi:multidrug resistance efflux pump